MVLLLLHIHGVPGAPLFLLLLVCLLLPLLLFLLCLRNRFVDSSPYLAFYPFPAEAALGRQIINISISFYSGQRGLLFFTCCSLLRRAFSSSALRSGSVVVSRALVACRCAR